MMFNLVGTEPDADGWISFAIISNGTVEIRVPVGELQDLEATASMALKESTAWCDHCSGKGVIDVGDEWEEEYTRCPDCNGSGRIRKNVNPRVACKHETTKTPNGKGRYVEPICTSKASPSFNKRCPDVVRRDCPCKEVA